MRFDERQFDLRRVDAQGIGTAYLDQGEGDAVVLVHGSGAGVTASANWWANVDVLSANARVIALELAGFGSTDSSVDGTYSISGWVDHLAAFLDALELESVHLVGNSLGGWISLEFARRYPARVQRMVLMGTGGAPSPPGSMLRQHQGYEPDLAGMRQLLLDFVVDESIVTDALVAHRFEASRTPEAAARFHATSAARARDRDADPLTEEKLRAVTHPTLLLHGREDRIIPATWSWTVHSWLANSDLHVFSNCGHWSQIERVDDFNELVTSHLVGP